MRRPNIRMIGIEKKEDSQHKGAVNIFNIIIKKKNFLNLMKDVSMNIKEAYKNFK